MITNKDISIDSENGKITLNGNKYDLGTQGEIDTAVKDLYSVMGRNGAKNLIPYPFYETTKTVNGVTFTDNGDGTITANGTATVTTQFGLVSRITSNYYLPNGVYTVTGCPNTSGCQIRVGRTVNNADAQYGQDTGSGLTFTRTDATNAMGIALQIASGTTVSNLTFKPMLRLASDTDNTYQPYAMTNKQLTDQLGTKQDKLTFDTTPTENSTNPVTSGGIYNKIGNLSTGATGDNVTDQIKFIYNRFYTKKQQNLTNAISTTIKLFLCAVVDYDTPTNYSLFIGTLNAAPSIIKENGLAVTFVNSIGTIAETTGATNYTITVFDLAS